MSKLPFLQETITVCYVSTSSVTRNYSSVMSPPPLLQETIIVCYVTTSFVTRNYNSVLWDYLCYKKL